MANGPNGTPSPVPAWLQPVAQIITTIGIPSLFAVVLLWYVLTKLDSALRTIMANEETRTAKLVQIETGFVSALDRQTIAFNTTIQGNIAAINRQTETFEEGFKENIAAIKQNAEINRQTAEAMQRMLTTARTQPVPPP